MPDRILGHHENPSETGYMPKQDGQVIFQLQPIRCWSICRKRRTRVSVLFLPKPEKSEDTRTLPKQEKDGSYRGKKKHYKKQERKSLLELCRKTKNCCSSEKLKSTSHVAIAHRKMARGSPAHGSTAPVPKRPLQTEALLMILAFHHKICSVFVESSVSLVVANKTSLPTKPAINLLLLCSALRCAVL